MESRLLVVRKIEDDHRQPNASVGSVIIVEFGCEGCPQFIEQRAEHFQRFRLKTCGADEESCFWHGYASPNNATTVLISFSGLAGFGITVPPRGRRDQAAA